MFKKVVVANRGAVAARVIRALREMGIASVAVYSEADAGAFYLDEADETYEIGPADPLRSYLNVAVLLDVLKRSGADGLHPGYGFLSENAGFALAVNAAGARFIGPDPRWIEAMGHKVQARDLMRRHGLPMAPSSPPLKDDLNAAISAAKAIGYPVLVKPTAGGGGIGMIAARDDAGLAIAIESARSLAARSFGNGEVYLERLQERTRHIEFQILADRHGHVRHLFERDCSIQRRNQKVIEESPAPGLSRDIVERAAQDMAGVLAKLPYDVIGTMETLHGASGGFHFLEMNTRLQVEHAVTEAITGVDLVKAQIRLAAGELLDSVLPEPVAASGHAIEARIYAEDPVKFYPSPGTLRALRFPEMEDLRVETGLREGNAITPHYDPLVAKLIIHARDRHTAIERMIQALDASVIEGVKHNIPFIRSVIDSQAFRDGDIHTGLGAQVLASRQPRPMPMARI